jgi:uncharacterized protein
MTDLQPTQNRSVLSRIFISPDEPRLRAGWRLLLQTVLLIVISIIATLIASFFSPNIGGSLIAGQLIELIAVTGSVYIARRWLDKRSFVSLGLELNRWTFVDILVGVVITFVLMGFIYVLMSVLGWLTFKGFAWQFDPISIVVKNVLIFFIGFIFVAWNEELLSRGYELQTIASGLNLFWGVVISSAIFGLLHLGNPNATWVSAAGIFFAGIFLAYAYVRTKQLWLSMGLHLGWNFFEGVVFGFPVSGLNIYPLTRIEVHGPEIWTGGAFGPEAGLIVLPALALGILLIYLYTRKRVV